ncbi:hypothetical protein CV093_18030 [Oceanobacillus sp. 143]|nr:hypothetical protein CV093_18030 [Oceanobacillus sp. 143]
MKEKGTLKNSEQYFHIPSTFAKEVLYYPTMGGNYFCSEQYETKRQRFEQYYFCYVKKGKMKVFYKDGKYIAKENDFFFWIVIFHTFMVLWKIVILNGFTSKGLVPKSTLIFYIGKVVVFFLLIIIGKYLII